MSFCNCCETEVCGVCYTGVQWSGNFVDYSAVTGEVYQGYRGGADYTFYNQLYRFYDPSGTNDASDRCGEGTGIRRWGGCGELTNNLFTNCSGTGYASNLYTTLFDYGTRIIADPTNPNNLLNPVSHYWPPLHLSNSGPTNARVSYGSVSTSLSNLTEIPYMTGGPYDTQITGIWSTFPYKHVANNRLYDVVIGNSIKYYNTDTDGYNDYLDLVDSSNPAWDFVVHSGSEPVYSYYLPGNLGIFQGVHPSGQDVYGAVVIATNDERYKNDEAPYIRERKLGQTRTANTLFGFYEINLPSLLSGVFQKTYISNVNFERFGDTSSDASGGKYIYQTSGEFGTGIDGAISPTGLGIPVTQFDGFTPFTRTVQDPTRSQSKRVWGDHSFSPFGISVRVYSEREALTSKPNNNQIASGILFTPRTSNVEYDSKFGLGVGVYSELSQKYEPPDTPATGVFPDFDNLQYYNDIPVKISQSAGCSGLVFTSGLGINTSDIFGGYQIEISVTQTGVPFTGIGSFGGRGIFGGQTGLFAPLEIVTKIPSFGFEYTGYCDLPLYRCMRGDAYSTVYNNHSYHEVIDNPAAYLIEPDNWDDVIRGDLERINSGWFPLAAIGTLRVNQRGNNISGARTDILNNLGVSSNSNFYLQASRKIDDITSGVSGISPFHTLLKYPLDSTATGVIVYKNLIPAVYGLATGQFAQNGTYWSYANGDQWATAVDAFVESKTSIRGDEYGEFAKSKGVAASHEKLSVGGDDPTAGLVLDKVTWFFRDSDYTVTGTQTLTAEGDYGSYTIPNGVEWVVGRSGGVGAGSSGFPVPDEYDLCTFYFDNLGLQTGTISGWTLDDTIGFYGSGVIETGSPLSGVIRPYQKFEFDFVPYSGFSVDWPGTDDPKRTDISFYNDANGYLIDNPFDFSILVYGTGGAITPPGL